MRAACIAIGVVLAACGHSGQPSTSPDATAPADAFDPYVYVEGGLKSGSWPNSQPITFTDNNGMMVPYEEVGLPSPNGTLRARMPDGGTIVFVENNSSSPTATSITSWEIDGVRPGDHFDFVDPAPPLPADCTARSITGWSVDSAGNATWTDNNADHVVARVAGYYQNMSTCCSSAIATWTTVDGLPSTSVPDGSALTYVLVLYCPHETYDDVRTIVGVAGWP